MDPWVRKICWRRDRLPTPMFLGFPGGSVGKESICNVGDLDFTPMVPTATHSSILAWRIPMDRGAWQATNQGVTKSQTRLSDYQQQLSSYFRYFVNHVELGECDCESCSVVSDSLRPPMNCSVDGILQARTLEWIAFPFSRGSSQSRYRTQVSYIPGRFFTS